MICKNGRLLWDKKNNNIATFKTVQVQKLQQQKIYLQTIMSQEPQAKGLIFKNMFFTKNYSYFTFSPFKLWNTVGK